MDGKTDTELLSAEDAERLTRIKRRGITNVVRHAQARTVGVELHRAAEGLQLVVRDDGIGFDVATAQMRAERG